MRRVRREAVPRRLAHPRRLLLLRRRPRHSHTLGERMSRARAKGTAAETAVVGYLQSMGFPHAERRALNGAKDRGDVAGIPATVIEVKNQVKAELAEWLKEAEAERDNDHAAWGVVWHRRRGKAFPGQWYVTMTGADFVQLLRGALGIEEGDQ